MTDPNLLGFGERGPQLCARLLHRRPTPTTSVSASCATGRGSCRTRLAGYSAVEAYLPSKKIAIAVVNTFLPAAYDAQGNNPNSAIPIYQSIGALMAPNDSPPTPNN